MPGFVLDPVGTERPWGAYCPVLGKPREKRWQSEDRASEHIRMSGPPPRGSAEACLLGSSGGSSGKHSQRSAYTCFAVGAKYTAALMSGVLEDVWWTWGGGPGARVRRALSPGSTSQWPPTGRCTVSEPQLLSRQNGYVSNTSCADLLGGPR